MTQSKLLEVTPELRKFKCKGCDETYFEDIDTGRFYTDAKKTDEIYCEYSEILEDWICEGCYENDNEHASTIVRYAPDETESVRFGDYVAYGVEFGDIPEWFWKYFDKREWKSTDAWRGYFQTTFKNGFIKLANGWLTGFPSEVKPEAEAIELYEYLKTHAEELPAPLYWLFEPTSNVFSTASEVFCDNKDLPAITKWLEANGFNTEELDNAFS